ncbi:elongator complex protein 1-like [Dorcoceras hygrometricum]|uniref:Elongator complex protein 1-like n=1 Tax=Dorcoceras hygrometricum TaxID=472368 RepID=A0A2Z6ZXQ8_9LAMI|nr:elongator complex protein 1-like [Dorcoceras hygrometricum]
MMNQLVQELRSLLKKKKKKIQSLFKKKKKRRWSWNEEVQQETTVGYQQMRRGARYGMSCDDISLDSQESAGSLHSRRKRKRRRRGDPVASYNAISRCYLKIAKRCRLHKLIRQRFALALKIQQEDFALLFQQTKLQWIQSQRKDIQTQLMNQSQATAASSHARIEEGAKRNSRGDTSAAKQLTTYSKMFVNC